MGFRWPFFPARAVADAPQRRVLPTPALRWVVREGVAEMAVRVFDWHADSETVALWQRETYAVNFPHFNFTPEFARAFMGDLRRATMDDCNGLFVLDEPETKQIIGFLWVVLCTNNWTGERYGYINNIYIAPAKRGLHLGEELLEQARIWFKTRKVSKLRLTVTNTNAAALKLYERAGFHVERLEMEREI